MPYTFSVLVCYNILVINLFCELYLNAFYCLTPVFSCLTKFNNVTINYCIYSENCQDNNISNQQIIATDAVVSSNEAVESSSVATDISVSSVKTNIIKKFFDVVYINF